MRHQFSTKTTNSGKLENHIVSVTENALKPYWGGTRFWRLLYLRECTKLLLSHRLNERLATWLTRANIVVVCLCFTTEKPALRQRRDFWYPKRRNPVASEWKEDLVKEAGRASAIAPRGLPREEPVSSFSVRSEARGLGHRVWIRIHPARPVSMRTFVEFFGFLFPGPSTWIGFLHRSSSVLNVDSWVVLHILF